MSRARVDATRNRRRDAQPAWSRRVVDVYIGGNRGVRSHACFVHERKSAYAADALSSGLYARWQFPIVGVRRWSFPQRPSGWRTGVDMLPCSGRILEPYIVSVHPFLIAREVVNPKKLHVSSLVFNDAIFMRSLFVYADLRYAAVYDVVGCRSSTLVKTAEGAWRNRILAERHDFS